MDAKRKITVWFVRMFCLCVLSAGSSWAQDEDEWDYEHDPPLWSWGTVEYNPVDGTSKVFATSAAADNLVGPFTCQASFTLRYIGPAEPSADSGFACDPEYAFPILYRYEDVRAHCQTEFRTERNADRIFIGELSDTVTSCVPKTCYESEPDPEAGVHLLKEGC